MSTNFEDWNLFSTHRVMCFSGAYETHKRDKCEYKTLSLQEILVLAKKPDNKEKPDALAIIPSSYCGFDARTHKVQQEKGSYVALCGDIDKGNPSLDDIADAIEFIFGSAIAFLIYSSSSATSALRKYRIIIPLEKPLPFNEWLKMMQAMRILMAEQNIELDRALERAGQPVYMPNVPSNRRNEDGLPIFWEATMENGIGANPDIPMIREKIITLNSPVQATTTNSSKQRTVAQNSPYDTNDPFLNAIIDRGLFVRYINDSTAAIICPFNDLHSDPDRKAGGGDSTYLLPHHNGYPHGMFFCQHSHHESGMDYQNKYQAAVGFTPFAALGIATSALEQSTPIEVAALQNLTQDNIALVFASRLRGRVCFAAQAGRWRINDGTRWAPDNLGVARHFAREVIRAANREGKTAAASNSFCDGVEKLARCDPALARDVAIFDRNNYLLNTPAGTFDLRINVMRQHNPDDHLTKITSVSPTEAGGERFLVFMQEVTGGDNERINFLQVALGACLSGAVEAHWLMFWTGVGRNGKNTLGDLVMFILGDYAKKIPVTTLMESKHSTHPTELASLAGVRLATSSEISDGAYWNESRINEITGDEMIAARFMGKDFFEFQRTHKHLIYGNHRPQLRSITAAVKARLVIVPFDQNFAGREDLELGTKLRAEAGFVLGWLIKGHAEWLRLGRKLPRCGAVERETAEYFSTQSTPELWVEECLEVLPDDDRQAKDLPNASGLYENYRWWKQERGEQPLSMTRWGDFMARRFTKEKPHSVVYRGCRLRSSAAFAGLPRPTASQTQN